MRRILFEWRGIRIWSYPAFLYFGFVFGMIAQNRAAHAAGLDPFRVCVATLILIPIAVGGSRVLYVATHWDRYRNARHRIWDRSEGGMSMYGGVPCMLLASLVVLPAVGLPFWRFWDVSTFCIFVGMIFTRVGCLLNGCCSGRPSEGPLALWLPDSQGTWQRRLPTQIFEAGLGALVLGVATVIGPARAAPGVLFLIVVTLYAIGRLALEPTRRERERVGGLGVMALISVALVILSLAGLSLLNR